MGSSSMTKPQIGILLLLLICIGSTVRAQYTAPVPSRASFAIAQLRELHFWTGSDNARMDVANRQAIVAFQKLAGLPRTGKLTDSTLARIARWKLPAPRDSLHRRHIEVDLNHQVLFVIDSLDLIEHILPISSGSGKDSDFPGKGKEFARTPR